jgi:hypothetical protein
MLTRGNGTDDPPADADGVVPVSVIVGEEPKERRTSATCAYPFCSYRTGSEKRGRRKGGAKTVAVLAVRLSSRKKKKTHNYDHAQLEKSYDQYDVRIQYTSPSNNTCILRRVGRRTQAAS